MFRKGAWVMLALSLAGSWSVAHPVYMEFIEHRARLAVDPAHIDITVELRFNEVQSLSERRKMDVDHDGAISTAEQRAYLRRATRGLADQVSLRVGGEPLRVIDLYDPELDLLGVDGISPNHHVLRLFLFARTPASLKAGDEIVLEDQLWPAAPSLWFFDAAGKESVRLTTIQQDVQIGATQPANDASQRVGVCRIDAIDQPGATSTQPSAVAEQAGDSAGVPTDTSPESKTTCPLAIPVHRMVITAFLLAILTAMAGATILHLHRDKGA